MSSTPDLAVVIPTYNRASLIGATLESVFAQTYPGRIEVMVIDDGSIDNTAAVVAPFVERGHTGRISVRYIPVPNAGVCAARNRGVAETTAPLVAFLDSDDVWVPEKLARQLPALDDLEVGVSHTAFRNVDAQGHFLDSGVQRLNNPCHGKCVTALLREDLVIFSSVIIRRSVIDAACAFEAHGLPFAVKVYAEDYDLLLRAALVSKFAYVPEPLTLYRVHDAQYVGNLTRLFRLHCQMQLDFVAQHGSAFAANPRDGHNAAQAFLYGRAEAMYWQRRLDTTRQLCELAAEMNLSDDRFQALSQLCSRPKWMLWLKDTLDRFRARINLRSLRRLERSEGTS